MRQKDGLHILGLCKIQQHILFLIWLWLAEVAAAQLAAVAAQVDCLLE
jgi:hypothetical protein